MMNESYMDVCVDLFLKTLVIGMAKNVRIEEGKVVGFEKLQLEMYYRKLIFRAKDKEYLVDLNDFTTIQTSHKGITLITEE